MTLPIGKQIGKGAFSRVYECKDDPQKVFIVTTDNAKEACSNGIVDSVLLPKLRRLDFFTNNENDIRVVYVADRYQKVKAPKKELNKKAYAQYVELRKVFESIGFIKNNYDSYAKHYEAFETIKNKALRKEMISMLDGFSNYGSDIAFEISPRNIAAGKCGNLILLDCFFFKNDLIKIRKDKKS